MNTPKLRVLQEPSPFSLPKTPHIIYGGFMATEPNPSERNKPCSPIIASKAALVSPQAGDTNPPAPLGTGLSPTTSTRSSQGFLLPLQASFPVPAPAEPRAPCPSQGWHGAPRSPDNASPVPKPWAGQMQGLLARREPREAAPARLPLRNAAGDAFCAFKSHSANFGDRLGMGPELVLAVEMPPASWALSRGQGTPAAPTPCST